MMSKKLIVMAVAFIISLFGVTAIGFSSWTYINQEVSEIDVTAYDVVGIDGVTATNSIPLVPGLYYFYQLSQDDKYEYREDKSEGVLQFNIQIDWSIYSGEKIRIDLYVANLSTTFDGYKLQNESIKISKSTINKIEIDGNQIDLTYLNYHNGTIYVEYEIDNSIDEFVVTYYFNNYLMEYIRNSIGRKDCFGFRLMIMEG